jgi:hypothetical protein
MKKKLFITFIHSKLQSQQVVSGILFEIIY